MIELTDNIIEARSKKPFQLPYEKYNINNLVVNRELSRLEYAEYKQMQKAKQTAEDGDQRSR